MQALLQQLPALIGVALEALTTYATTAAAERGRWRRGQSVRWDEKRVNAYTEYAHSIKRVISIAVRLASYNAVHPGTYRVSPEEGRVTLASAEEQRTIAWEAVLLFGSNAVVTAAREWHQCAFHLERIASGHHDELTWSEAVSATSRARREFHEAARQDIGVPIGNSPEVYEWQLGRFMKPDGS